MGESGDEFTWRDYEEYIYDKLVEWAEGDVRVEFNQTIVGRYSQVQRQVDALVTGRFAGVTDREITAAVDCKYYTRNIDVKKVDEFLGFVDDVATDLGLLITNKDFTEGATRRAAVRGIELRVIVANIDRLPPPAYHPGWDDSYYESDYWTVEGRGRSWDGAIIRYSYIDPAALEYSFDPDHPPERLDDVVLSGSDEEVSWGDDEARANCVRAILRHREGGAEPSPEDVKRVVLELAYHWRDGFPWILGDSQLASLGV